LTRVIDKSNRQFAERFERPRRVDRRKDQARFAAHSGTIERRPGEVVEEDHKALQQID
jgi:hypothetical protein